MYISTSYARLSDHSFLQDRAISELFSRAYLRGQWLQIWSLLTRKPHSLLSIGSIDTSRIENIHDKAGIQTIPINQIRGSEGRAYDFDCEFNPLVRYTRDRWMGIASARMRGRYLPAVVLAQVGDLYFVLDGHHRISVAKALGETVVEARVMARQDQTR